MLTSLTVMAHGAAQATFSRHVKYWDYICSNILVICPETDPLKDCPYPMLRLGGHCHAGHASVDRLKQALGNIVKHSGGHHMIFEYDSIPLAQPKLKTGFCGVLRPNYEPLRFMAQRYPNPPWMLDWRSAYLMLDAASRWPDVWEEGFADRYLAALAMLAGVPILDFDPPGFTDNTIDRKQWFDMEKAIWKGATMIHGIKDEATLQCALAAYDKYGNPKKQ